MRQRIIRRTTRLALRAALVAALAGCAAHGPTGATCPADNALTYDSFGRAFFASYCNRCHGTGPDTFDDVAYVRRDAPNIDRAAAAGPDAFNTVMPRSGPAPSANERTELGQWLACGAP